MQAVAGVCGPGMGHNTGQAGHSSIPSCCHWWWSCCCCHCSGSFYTDNVVQSESNSAAGPDAANLLGSLK